MKSELPGVVPRARNADLITKDAEGELLIYDRINDRAHCLNSTAAIVWRLCDGKRSVTDIADCLKRADLNVFIDKSEAREVVALAVQRLMRARLLVRPSGEDAHGSATMIPKLRRMKRRDAIKRIGLGAAIALPTVMSLTAPTPAEASVSCKQHCDTCSSPVECCGACATNVSGCTGSPRCT